MRWQAGRLSGASSRLPLLPSSRFPALSAYKARIEGRAAYQRALEAEGLQQFYDRDFYDVPEG